MPGSRVFDKAGASGLRVGDWQNVIMVNMLGKRFYDETGRAVHRQQYNPIKPYVPDSYRNAKNVKYDAEQFHQRRDGRHRRRHTMAAARSGRSSMPMRSRARSGTPEPP